MIGREYSAGDNDEDARRGSQEDENARLGERSRMLGQRDVENPRLLVWSENRRDLIFRAPAAGLSSRSSARTHQSARAAGLVGVGALAERAW